MCVSATLVLTVKVMCCIQCCLVTVIFHCNTVSMQDVGNCNMGWSATNIPGNVRVFHGAAATAANCFQFVHFFVYRQ